MLQCILYTMSQRKLNCGKVQYNSCIYCVKAKTKLWYIAIPYTSFHSEIWYYAILYTLIQNPN